METRRTFGKQALAMATAALAAQAVPHLLRAQGDTQAASTTQAAITGAGSLKAHAVARGIFIGAAVNMRLLAQDLAYKRTIIEQYNIVVAENAMKWAALRPGPDTFDFAEADRFIAFAEANGMAIRGHNLCWHEALPGWFAATVNKNNAEHHLVNHIETVVSRYRGKIRAWDVVNEAIELKDGQPDGFRNGPWYKLLGSRFIEIAFRTARQADPHALLTYNDYSIETDGQADTGKRDAVLALVKHMKNTGIPLDVIGIQSHLSADSAGQIGKGLTGFVRQSAALGLKLSITELDVNDDALGPGDADVRGKEVAAIYRNYTGMLLQNPAVTDVLTWGVANKASWLNASGGSKFRPRHPEREEICLPFNDSYQPNPAFYALRGVLGASKPTL